MSHEETQKKSSLAVRIASMTFIVALLAGVLTAAMLIAQYNRAILRRGNQHIEESIRIMSDRISSVLTDGELCANTLTLTINQIYNNKSASNASRNAAMYATLMQNTLIFEGVDSAVFIDAGNTMYASEDKMKENKVEILASDYFKTLHGVPVGKTILMDIADQSMERSGAPVVTLGKVVTDISSGKTLGYLFVNLSEDYLISAYDSELSSYLLFDRKGTCLTGTQKEEILQDQDLIRSLYQDEDLSQVSYQGDQFLVARRELEGSSWILLGLTNVNRFNVGGRELLTILLITSAITLVLSGLTLFVVTRIITRPLRKLRVGAEKIAAGDLTVRFTHRTGDEIGQFARTFNYMTEQNQQLIVRIDEEARKKREYELALIQEQVKPHFLYNTLDIIIMLIEMKRGREAARVTRKLADYYKNSLSGSEEIVTIRREKQIISDYLDLQLMRYGDKFNYEIDVPEELDDVEIPKMTLQPLVENAIYHGIKQKEGWGKIVISGHKTSHEGKTEVWLIISDNGIGMTPDTVDKLRAQMNVRPEEIEREEMGVRNDRKHFGVYSCSHRIQLYYGPEYGIDFESSYGIGTRVIVRIPEASRTVPAGQN